MKARLYFLHIVTLFLLEHAFDTYRPVFDVTIAPELSLNWISTLWHFKVNHQFLFLLCNLPYRWVCFPSYASSLDTSSHTSKAWRAYLKAKYVENIQVPSQSIFMKYWWTLWPIYTYILSFADLLTTATHHCSIFFPLASVLFHQFILFSDSFFNFLISSAYYQTLLKTATLVQWLEVSPRTLAAWVQGPGPTYRQFRYMPKTEVSCTWGNSAT